VVLGVAAAADGWEGGPSLATALEAGGAAATLWIRVEDREPRPLTIRAGEPAPYPATVFEQVHPAMGDRVRAYAVEALGRVDGREVWDLYAGIGETTAALVRVGARVQSVESDPRAVAEADERGPAADRVVGRVERVLSRLRRPDLVITNPPRTGMDERVTEELERVRPERIVYVSCDPATLARDLGRMPGFRLAGVLAFDLFPQTAHVETVVTLERR
jgi:23S rRNA (uracil1939-C5)-methyltransferase